MKGFSNQLERIFQHYKVIWEWNKDLKYEPSMNQIIVYNSNVLWYNFDFFRSGMKL